MKEELFDSFFKEGAEFWIGKVVAIDAQKTNCLGVFALVSFSIIFA